MRKISDHEDMFLLDNFLSKIEDEMGETAQSEPDRFAVNLGSMNIDNEALKVLGPEDKIVKKPKFDKLDKEKILEQMNSSGPFIYRKDDGKIYQILPADDKGEKFFLKPVDKKELKILDFKQVQRDFVHGNGTTFKGWHDFNGTPENIDPNSKKNIQDHEIKNRAIENKVNPFVDNVQSIIDMHKRKSVDKSLNNLTKNVDDLVQTFETSDGQLDEKGLKKKIKSVDKDLRRCIKDSQYLCDDEVQEISKIQNKLFDLSANEKFQEISDKQFKKMLKQVKKLISKLFGNKESEPKEFEDMHADFDEEESVLKP